MTKLARTLAVLTAALVLAPAISIAQDDWQTDPAPQAQEPEALPPPPAEAQAQPAPEASQAVPPGQWVYTQQYGWIWIPYSDAYTNVPSNGYGSPYVYVYSPSYSCWTWLAAPWIWGIGPWPYFGIYGPTHYAWYGWGWWQYPNRWHYAPSPAPGYAPRLPRPGYSTAWSGARGPYRGAYRTPYRGAPAYRAPAPYRGGGYRGGGTYQAPAPWRGGAPARPGGSSFMTRPQAPARGGFAVRPGGSGGGSRAGRGGGGWHGHGRG